MTRNISSGGLFIKTDKTFPIRARLQLLLEWPAKFRGKYSLLLKVSGRVLRSGVAGTAVEIMKYRLCPVGPTSDPRRAG
jgi:hypothetical protein